jgi:hypothetical protein
METTMQPPLDPAERLASLTPRDSSAILPRRRRGFSSLARVMLALVLLAAGLFLGAELEKRYGSSSSTSARPAGAFAGGAFARAGAAGAQTGTATTTGGFQGSTGSAGAATGAQTGQVKLIKGSTIYLSDFFGNTLKITIPATVTVSKTLSASASSIRPGDTVSVQGSQQKDGSYTATSVSVTPAG